MVAVDTYALPRGPRDTRAWYRDADPLEQVDRRAGGLRRRRTPGAACSTSAAASAATARCSPSAASRCAPSTWCRSTSSARASSGCAAELYDGERLPLADDSVDTAILLEVIEHLEDPARLLARGAQGRARGRAGHHAQLHAELRPRAGRVQPHARRGPPPVLHRGLAGGAARRGVRQLRGGAGRADRPQPRRAGAAAAAAPALPRCSTASAQPSRATSSGCAPARPPGDARPVHLGRAASARRWPGPAIRVLELARAVAAALRGDAGGARPERRRRRPGRAARGAPGRLRRAAGGDARATTWSWRSASRRSCCATSRACRCASWPTSTTRR